VQLKKSHFLILLLWGFVVTLGLTSRSYFPIDETRYATVAWNMWLSGDHLVPYLNGIAYSHKPPLLFWLMNLGWKIFGVNDWWPRLIPSIFALLSVFITRKIASLLWPIEHGIKDNASLILISCGLWVVYSTALMFDMMIAFFTTLGIWGLLLALKKQNKNGWLMLALAIGGGLLAKGPTILLQILPAALLTPIWNKDFSHKLSPNNWYLPIFYAVLGGIIIALFWAIPAAIHGGYQYRHDIFWGQTADRMVNSFAHQRPIWWYLAASPLLLFPWLFLGTFWRSIVDKKIVFSDFGLRFCFTWLAPVFIAFSFISGKQVHYVLPIFPAAALIIARFISLNKTISKVDITPICIAFMALGCILLYLPHYAQSHGVSVTNWSHLSPFPGLFAISLGFFLYFYPKESISNTILVVAVSTITLVAITMFGLLRTAGDAYDVRPISNQIKMLESSDVPVAVIGKYAGTYDFVGRLNHPPENIEASNVTTWFEKHADGRVIAFFNQKNKPKQVDFLQNYKGQFIAILTRPQWIDLHGTTQENTDTP
jgi:4-amino-4-deoxy-L-arabinose transferase-like glycosyltransferase